MDVNEEMLRSILAMYRPERIHLQRLEVIYPNREDIKFGKGKGIFKVRDSEYREDWPHVTDVQQRECINQLSFVTFGQLINDGKLNGLEDITLEQFVDKRKEILIRKPKFYSYRKITPTESFDGNVVVTGRRRNSDSYIVKVDFSLDKGATIGDMGFVLPL